MRLVLRNVRPWGGDPVDILLDEGLIAQIGLSLAGGAKEIDGRGDTLLPGLHDHHLHIMALAARRQSIDLTGELDPKAIVLRLRQAKGDTVRAVGYDERAAPGLPDRALLDRWSPDRPLRLQDRTGALWMLNSSALALLKNDDLPSGAERDSTGIPNGRFWREDRWLGRALPRIPLDLGGLGAELAGLGLTALTDASAHNGPDEARVLAGCLPQRLVVMGNETLQASDGFALGPLKLLIDERDPPELSALAARITSARQAGRNVAAHCVTEAELALYMAALDLSGGPVSGDRIEHGGMIPAAFIPVIREMGLVVTTNPAFLHDRGERYLAEVEPIEDLYRVASLQAAGIPVKAGSDAPYASVDPWLGMRSVRDRLTARGALLGGDERISAESALRLYCPGKIAQGEPADLILCRGTFAEVLDELSAKRVRLTLIAGQPITRD